MADRLHWKLHGSGASGAVRLPAGALPLVLDDGRLERAGRDPGARDGIVVRPLPDASGGFRVEARGGVLFETADGTRRGRVDLAPGETVAFLTEGGERGELRLSGGAERNDPLVGRTLGAFRVLGVLGRGAVGRVYRALQEGLEREVALKVLDPEVAAGKPEARESFRREAIAAGRLSHPHLVQVFDFGESEGLLYYAMELVPGGSLEERLRDEGPLPWDEALRCAMDAAEALDFAREHGLVHRDVKPDNLMVAADGRVKLADLGMAATREMLERESAGGTPHFMAPECVGSGAVDHRADLYSLGCTLYRLLTGETPYSGSSVRDILRAHRDAPIPSVREHAPETPAEVDDLVAWLMAKSPDERPDTAGEFLAAAEEVLAPKRSRVPLVLGGVVVVAALGAAAFFALRRPEPAEPERVVEYRQPAPDAAAEAEREALAEELAFTRALAEPTSEAKAAALEAFLAEHPDSEFAARARAELDRLAEEAAAAAAAAAAAETDPLAEARERAAALGAELDDLMAAHRFGAALAAVEAADLPEELRAPLGDEVLAAADAWLAEAGRRHQTALDAGDLAAAAAVRDEAAAALSDLGAAAAPLPWGEATGAMESAARAAEEALRRAAFRAQLAAAHRVLTGDVAAALDRGDPEAAAKALHAAAAAAEHAGLAAALERGAALLDLAAAARGALERRLAASGDDGIAMVEPKEHKRGFALDADDEGVRMLVQVRGERVERRVSWADYRDPEAFASLVGLAETASPAERNAWILATAARDLAVRCADLASAPPDPARAAELAARVEAWLAAAPAADDEPEAVAAERRALEELGAVFRALAEGDDYLALQLLDRLLARFSLVTAWCADAGTDYGLEP